MVQVSGLHLDGMGIGFGRRTCDESGLGQSLFYRRDQRFRRASSAAMRSSLMCIFAGILAY